MVQQFVKIEYIEMHKPRVQFYRPCKAHGVQSSTLVQDLKNRKNQNLKAYQHQWQGWGH